MAENEEVTTQVDSKVDEAKEYSLLLPITVMVISLLIVLTFAVPFFLDNSALKFQLVQKVSQSLQTKLTIYGKVKITLLPYPAVVAEDVVMQNYQAQSTEKAYDLYAKSVEVRFPFLNFAKDSEIKRITFSDAVFSSYYNDPKLPPRFDELTKMVNDLSKNPADSGSATASGISVKLFPVSGATYAAFKSDRLPEVVLKNAKIIFYDKLVHQRIFSAINANAEISKEKIESGGNFVSENIPSKFKLVAKFNSQSKEQDSLLDLVSPALELHVKGNFISENKGLLTSGFVGKVNAQIMDLKSFYKSYVDNNDVIAAKLKYNAKPIKISAEVDSGEQETLVNNIIISSDLVSGNGQLDLSLINPIPAIDILFDLDNLDLDSIWLSSALANEVPQEVSEEKETADESENGINLDSAKKLKNFDLTAEISAKRIRYLEGEITDSNLYLTISKEGEMMVMPLIFKVPGSGVWRVTGVVDQTTATPKFIGEFDAVGKSLQELLKLFKIESQNLRFDAFKDYTIYSDILFLPNSVKLSNFYLNLGSGENEISGEVKIISDGKAMDSKGKLHIKNLNIDDYFLISGQNTYLSPGSLLRKIFWLNDISSSGNFGVSFDKMIYKKEEFAAQSFSFKVGRGYFGINDLTLQSPQTDLQASLNVDISNHDPQFDLKFNAKKFHYETADVFDVTDPSKTKQVTFFDQFFALPSLEDFSGDISVNIADSSINGVVISSGNLAGRMKNGNIEKTKITGEFFNGSFVYQGMLGLRINKVINGNLTLTDVDLRPLFTDLFGVKNLAGVANFAASVTAVASNKSEFAKGLKSEAKFSASVPSVDGYGLNDLIKKMFAPQSYAQDLQDPEKILFNPQAKTIFNKAEGTIQINNGNDGRLRISVNAPAVNGILSGTFSAEEMALDTSFNVIFLTGDQQKQTPISIATNFKGKTSNILQSTNIDQVRQYLGLPKTPSKPAPAAILEKSVLVQ
ncbi:MAG: AsmA family protein [Alphaproteobacteria bacterium]|nr:AsmA family protein [Alphaproteobacteria bacterium]